jgi:hypothetical protein
VLRYRRVGAWLVVDNTYESNYGFKITSSLYKIFLEIGYSSLADLID